MIDLNQNVRYIKGVGPSRVEVLKKINVPLEICHCGIILAVNRKQG